MAKILLVDDEPRIARVVRDMVEGADWQFAYADNGADALDAVARETPDLIIMDVMMPKMDGFTACRELRTGASPYRSSSYRPKGTSWTRASGSQPGATTIWSSPSTHAS